MPRLRRLSGDDAIKILGRFGFALHSQRRRHVKLRRDGPGGERQTLTVPRHKGLDTGTCRAILRQASRLTPEAELAPFFYVE